MLGAGRVAGSGANSSVFFTNERLIIEIFIARVAPIIFPYLKMEIFRKTLGKPVGERFKHNGAIVIIIRFKGLNIGLDSDAGRTGKGTDIIVIANKIRERTIGLAVGVLGLLAKMMEEGELGFSGIIGIL